MTLKLRPYVGEQDWQAIADLIQSDPHSHHRIDFPWRLCSTSLEDYRNAAVWEDETGHMQMFAALQFPWLTLDYAIRPEIRNWDIEKEVIKWGESRLCHIAEETDTHFPFNVSVYAHERERIAFMEGQGYSRWEHFIVLLKRSLDSMAKPDIPDGFLIRPLAGEREVEEYVALQRSAFESTTMTDSWRHRTFRAPLYDNSLDLVAVGPDGRLVGFCIWWYHPQLKTAQIEPLGVHPDFQGLGLGHALILEGLGRVAARGAETALVETYSFSQPALKAYEAAGFEIISQELKYYKEY